MVSGDGAEDVAAPASGDVAAVDRVVILDAGAQFGAVIDRTCREIGVQSHVKPLNTTADRVKVKAKGFLTPQVTRY